MDKKDKDLDGYTDEDVSANNWKTFLLLCVIAVIILLLGYGCEFAKELLL